MNLESVSCQRDCGCGANHQDLKLIVLTGGPGAGKTAALEFMRKVFCQHVAILPEAASILFGGGFWRLDSKPGRRAAQRAIFHVQREIETMAREENKWSVGLCDRGTLDGVAYWPNGEDEFLQAVGANESQELARYHAVIHLQSPSLVGGYNHSNPMRVESPALAAEIDQRIHEVWKSHPNYVLIGSTLNFVEKVNAAIEQVRHYIPECCRGSKRGIL